MSNPFQKFGNWLSDTVAGNIVQTFIIPFGFIKTGVDMYNSAKEAAEAQAEAEKQSRISSALNGDISSLPYIKGAKNTIATGKTQPYIIGRHLFTPYILNGGGGTYKGFHRIGGTYGSKQYYYVVLEGGFNKQVLESLNVGDVRVLSFGGGTPQEGKWYFDAGSDFADGDSFVEISQDGAGFETSEFNKKTVENEVNAQLKYADDEDYEDLIYTLDKNAMAVDITIMLNGCYAVDSSGNKTEKTRSIVPAWSSDYEQILSEGGDTSQATWHEFTFEQKSEVTSTSYINGIYSYKYSYKCGNDRHYHFQSSNQIKANIKAQKSSWTLISGTDMRDDSSASFNVTYTTKTNYNRNTVTVSATIKMTKTTTTTTQTTTESNAFSYNKQSQIRFNAHCDLPFSACFDSSTDDDGNTVYSKKSYPVAVRISTSDKSDDKAKADCYVQYVQSTCFENSLSLSAGAFVAEKVVADREARFSTLIGVKIEATSANEDKLDKISVVTNGLAPVWSGSGWNGSKEPTSNIASWTLEILTSDAHSPSKMSADEIDLTAFGAWYEYCEEYGLYVNKVLTSGAQKETILASLAQAGRAVLYQDSGSGKISVAYDRIQDESRMLINPENLVSFSWKKDMGRQPDGVKLTYIDSANDAYDTDSLVRMYEQYSSGGADQWADSENRDYDAEITEIDSYGITDYTQAYAYMDYIMRCARLRLKDVTAVTGKECCFLRPYDRVTVQHYAIGRGEGSTRIKKILKNAAGYIIAAETYEPLAIQQDETFYVAIQCTGSGEPEVKIAEATTNATRGNFVYFSYQQSFSLKVGDIMSYGLSKETVTEDFIVRSVQPNGSGYSLSLTEYDERIFENGEIPEYESPLSLNGDIRKVNIPADGSVTQDDIDVAVAGTVSSTVERIARETAEEAARNAAKEAAGDAAQEAADVVQHGIHFKNVHQITDFASSIDDLQKRIDDAAADASSGISITEDEILLFVESKDAAQSAALSLKAAEIMSVVNDNDTAQTTALQQTRDAIQAMVRGGGTVGYMALSTELPAVIDNATYAKMLTAGISVDDIGTMYTELDNSKLIFGKTVYTIKESAKEKEAKALYDKLAAAGLLASQFKVEAKQIVLDAGDDGTVTIGGQTIFTSSKTSSVAESTASSEAAAKRNEMAKSLGYDSYDAMAEAASQQYTVIKDGMLNTTLIDTEALFAKDIVVSNVLQTANFKDLDKDSSIDSTGVKIDANYGTIIAEYLNAKEIRLSKGLIVDGEALSINGNTVSAENLEAKYQLTAHGVIQQGFVTSLDLFRITFVYYQSAVHVLQCSLDSSYFTLERIKTGIYKMRISHQYIYDNFRDINLQGMALYPKVIFASDAKIEDATTYNATVDGTAYTKMYKYRADTRYAALCRIVKDSRTGWYHDNSEDADIGPTTSGDESDNITYAPMVYAKFTGDNGTLYKDGAPGNFTSVSLDSDDWYSFYFVFTDNSGDAFEDVTGGADIVVTAYK